MKTIDTDFDLNLLRVLVALNQTRSVTQAAILLGLSQSGFSTALARLREKFDDPVFVRTSSGMTPTPKAMRMIETSAKVLSEINEGILDQPAFDPKTSTTEFVLGLTDVAEIVILPRLLHHLQEHAPLTTVTVGNYSAETLKVVLENGDIDLAVGYFPELSGRGFFKQRFYTHTYACLARRDHPVVNGKISLVDYFSLGHVMVTSPARSSIFLERFLEKNGFNRRIVLKTPHHLSLPSIVETTDLIATVALAACARFAQMGTVQLLKTPFTPPSFPVQQHWHRRMHQDERHRWLRAQMVQLFNESQDEWHKLEIAMYGKNYRAAQVKLT